MFQIVDSVDFHALAPFRRSSTSSRHHCDHRIVSQYLPSYHKPPLQISLVRTPQQMSYELQATPIWCRRYFGQMYCWVVHRRTILEHSRQIGITIVSEIRQAGGDVIRTSGRRASHATLVGLNHEQISELFNPTESNPAKYSA